MAVRKTPEMTDLEAFHYEVGRDGNPVTQWCIQVGLWGVMRIKISRVETSGLDCVVIKQE